MAMMIADTACVDPRAELDDDVRVGPHCVIGPDVRIGRGTRLIGHCCILGATTLGADNVVHPFAVLGGEPAQVPPLDRAGRLEIGAANVIREHVCIQSGQAAPAGATRIGDRNLLMAGVHVGSGAVLGDRITIGDAAVLGAGVQVDSHAAIAAGVTIHRRVTIGAYGYVGARARILHDVPPYLLVDGNPARVRGVNLHGLRRRGITRPAIAGLREAHRLLYRARMGLDQAAEILAAHGHRMAEVEDLLAALRAQQAGRHGRARGKAAENAESDEI